MEALTMQIVNCATEGNPQYSRPISPIDTYDRVLKSNINELKLLESLITSSRIQSKDSFCNLTRTGGTRIVQSLSQNIKRLKDKILKKLATRNEIAETLGLLHLSYQDLRSNSTSELWNRFGDVTMDQLMAFLHWKRLKEEIEYLRHDICRTISHIDNDVAYLESNSIKMHEKYDKLMVDALEAVKRAFIQKIQAIKAVLEG
jgi:hypothetical protein